MKHAHTLLTKNGRVLIPASIRKVMDIKPNTELIVRYENNTVTLIPFEKAIEDAQELVRKYNPNKISLTESLLKTRREESENE